MIKGPAVLDPVICTTRKQEGWRSKESRRRQIFTSTCSPFSSHKRGQAPRRQVVTNRGEAPFLVPYPTRKPVLLSLSLLRGPSSLFLRPCSQPEAREIKNKAAVGTRTLSAPVSFSISPNLLNFSFIYFICILYILYIFYIHSLYILYMYIFLFVRFGNERI